MTGTGAIYAVTIYIQSHDPDNPMNATLDQNFNNMAEIMGNPEGIKLPPNCFLEMKGKFIEHRVNQSLKVSFPIEERFYNPAGYLLGGMLSAFFDNTMGPLSYLTAKRPTTSLDLNVTFIRSIKKDDGDLLVEAIIIKHTKRFIIFEGKAYNSAGELIATATSRMMILGV